MIPELGELETEELGEAESECITYPCFLAPDLNPVEPRLSTPKRSVSRPQAGQRAEDEGCTGQMEVQEQKQPGYKDTLSAMGYILLYVFTILNKITF